MGFSYTTNLERLHETVKSAVFNAKSNVVDENFILASKSQYPAVKEVYDDKIRYLDLEGVVDFAKSMIKTAVTENASPPQEGSLQDFLNTFIANSEDVFSHDSSTMFSGFISVNVHDGDGVSTAHESDSSRYMDIDPEKISRKACEIARESRNGKPIETKDMDVVLDYNAASALLATFINSLNADNVQRGRSVYADKLGQEVISTSLNIYDDGTLPRGLRTSRSDGEGVPSQKTVLVKNGILKNFFLRPLHLKKKEELKAQGME